MARTKRTAEPGTAVGYVRVSTSEQADSGLGLAAQRAAIDTECTRRAWTCVAVHEDAGASGKSLDGRDGLQQALRAVQRHDAAVLVVAKLDRLSRSLADFAALMAQAKREGWNLVALDLGIDLDTAAGEFMANVMASAAQWERRVIGQRTADALAVRRSKGLRLGRPPKLPDTIVRRILDERAAGAGWSKIAHGLNTDAVPTAHGGARWYPSTIRHLVLAHGGI